MIVLQRQSHSGLAKSWGFCVSDNAAGYSSVVRKFHAGIERLKDVHYRMRKVQVENLCWPEILQKYDRKDTLFYLDPPYIHSTRIDGNYEHELSDIEHTKLVSTLLNLQGKAILSGYYHEIYAPLEHAGWNRIEIESIAYCSGSRTKRVECLWISPTCQVKSAFTMSIDLLSNMGYTKKQVQVYSLHKQRVDNSTTVILEAIRSLKKLNKRVTKTEVSRMTGISRVHISRRYHDLFK